jgi:transcription antitermination factor NusG
MTTCPHTDKQWFVLYTAPRAEKKVAQRLKETGVETFLPLHLSPRRWSDRIKLIEMPLFPSYIFVHTVAPELRQTLTVPGVLRVVQYDNKPAVMRNNEMEAIQLFLEQARAKELSYAVNEEVLIACGPLKDISGKIIKVGKSHLVLHLNQIGVTVSVPIAQISKTKKT